MKQESIKIRQELWDRFYENNKDASFTAYMYTLDHRASELIEKLSDTVEKQQRELDIAQTQAETWKQSYLEQVKENVLMQAKLLVENK